MRSSSERRGVVWVAVVTHHFKEAQAVDNLARQGFDAYCPMVRKRVRHARRLSEVLRPLFPGYVFVSLDAERDQWRPILSTIGVRTLIRFGDRFGVLPEKFVDGLRDREKDGAVPLPRYRDEFAPGEMVRFREGPFSGIVAKVLSSKEQDRLLLLTEMLRQSVRVEASISDVVPA